MGAVLEQLELNYTFFVQIAVFFALFLFLSHFYFKPFLKLFEARHKKTVEDREAAERLVAQATARLEEYKKRLGDERANIRKDFETALSDARKEESMILLKARDEARAITQEAAESVARQQEQLKKQLEADVESIAKLVSEGLLSAKG